LPTVPAIDEFIAGYESSAWFGIGAPKNTPNEIVDKLNKEINLGLADPKLMAGLADLGGTVLSGSPADFGKLRADEDVAGDRCIAYLIPANVRVGLSRPGHRTLTSGRLRLRSESDRKRPAN
jgi:hypothetical protein